LQETSNAQGLYQETSFAQAQLQETSDRLLASVLKMHRSNKIYKFVSTGIVSIST